VGVNSQRAVDALLKNSHASRRSLRMKEPERCSVVPHVGSTSQGWHEIIEELLER
jgi:hypothetical protein